MKKNMVVFVMAVLLGGILAGCGDKGKNGTAGTADAADTKGQYLSDLTVDEYVTLGEYKGIAVSVPPVQVTEEDKEATVNNILSSYPMPEEITEAAAEGHEVNIDFVGKKDGVEFEGGTSKGYKLVLGSGSFIADLEQGIIGMKKGEVKDIPVTFPKDYKSADLAGKDAVFTVTMNSVSRFPEKQELTDEYVAWLTMGEQKSVDEFHKEIETNLLKEAQNLQNTTKQSKIADAVVADSEYPKLPEKYVERIKSAMTSNLTSYATMYGMELGAYMVYTKVMAEGQDPAEVIATQSETTAKRYLAFQKIADKENLNISDSEYKESIEAAAKAAESTVEKYEASIDTAGYREFLMLEKVMTFIEENAVVTIE